MGCASCPSPYQTFTYKLSILGFTLPAGLEYVGTPVTASFQSQGGQFPQEGQYPLDKYHGLSISVPPQAVPGAKEVKLKIGVCCYGPFSIREHYQIASDFVVIVADGKFDKPVKVALDHCLILPEYKECSEVLILKASHLEVTEDGLYTFDQFTYPEISPDRPELSFEIKEFCILCAVLDEGERVRTSSLDSTTSSSLAHIDDNNPSSARSSFDEEAHPLGVERSYSSESQTQTPFLRGLSTSSEGALETPGGSPQKESYNLRKRKADSLEKETVAVKPSSRSKSTAMTAKKRHAHWLGRSSSSTEKRRCEVEYAALLFQDKRKVVDIDNQTYQFVIFICTNCGGAHKVILIGCLTR